MLIDAPQRAQATDPRQSFIVQAPAGSGKTELLTQRYLRLLSTVSAPEQIVALTFTRKAASEMRERIFSALKQATNEGEPASPHQKQTFRYAKEALLHSQALDWQLLNQPGRLRIVTIDSLCQTLSQAIPLQEKQIPYAQITDKPQNHYRRAARACLAQAIEEPALQESLKNLLHHLDNRQDKILDLFSDLLSRRSEWLAALYLARDQTKSTYEDMLAKIEQHEILRFKQSVPIILRDDLCSLAREVASIEANHESPRFKLCDWHSFENLDREMTISLAALLLTSQKSLRKSFDHHVGLKRGRCEDALYTAIQGRSKELLAQLEATPDFLEALLRVKNLPPSFYDQEQWQTLQALFTLLPYLAAHLHLVFSEHNEVDFTAISQQALSALGSNEAPTDLALYLDHSIQHLLVDEFQDTSIQQFQLLTKLVQHWEPKSGRTLFLVGDPMQSIYRFRQAEVGLFLKAREEGIGPVRLTPLALCCNFRSHETLVNWVNQQFQTLFPSVDDIEAGAISFHPSTPTLRMDDTSTIQTWQFPERKQEAEALVTTILGELNHYPDDKIAILVRSRNQLTDIVRLLREREIPFQGVNIELLSKLPHLRDLWSLTQALFMPANRLAWLSLLRSPFCGLTLADLYQVAKFDKKKSIYHALSQYEEIPSLSDDGRIRIQFVSKVLGHALSCRHQQSAVDWLRQTVDELQGAKILDSIQQADLEQFWHLLEQFTPNGLLPDFERINHEFDQLYSERVNPSRLQIMTIHKSKGLEFDCVIMPGLSASSANNDNPLLRWLRLPGKKQEELFLVSPIKPAYREDCPLYDYLGMLDSEKEHYELQRLLYVAVTRAKKRLYLFDFREKERKGSLRHLLQAQNFLSKEDLASENHYNAESPLLYRLPQSFYKHSLAKLANQASTTAFIPESSNARELGILTHELLQWICNNHPRSIKELPWQVIGNRFKILGFTASEQQESQQMLSQQLERLFNDPVGQWLIKAHEAERNEYELLVNQAGVVSTRIIDRTFIENHHRWIIDFKTGSEKESAQNHHRQQVNDYARLFSHLPNPLRCGLYYLATGTWVTWEYSALEENTLYSAQPQ